MRELAADSLELLSAALLDARFPALFDLRIWGALIGMFELNNLDLFVPGPSLRWRGGLEALPEAEAEAVEAEAGESRMTQASVIHCMAVICHHCVGMGRGVCS